MEEKVQTVLKLISEDGDSFAKRAEMYYKKRPEIISFVEESYRAYRSLAERYDKISTELQNANSTIATVFPERVQYPMDDEEEYDSSSPKFRKSIPNSNNENIPKVPTIPNSDQKGILKTATRKLKTSSSPLKGESRSKNVTKSGLSKSEAIGEIDKVQKEILALQTVKEFVKSSYESGLKKHWEIENQITELQERVFSLEDEFKVGKVIEDDEARTLMAEAALRSCEETLAMLQEKQEISGEKARAESQRVDDAREKIKSLKKKLLLDFKDERDNKNGANEAAEVEILDKKKIEDMSPKGSLTVTELVEKIDELVDEVISLETSVSSQTALVDGLRTETDDLQAQIRALEDDKVSLVNDKDSLINKLREMEEKLNELQKLNENVEKENKNLKTSFVEAHSSHAFLSGKLYSVKPDEDATPKSAEETINKLGSLDVLKADVANENDKQVSGTSVDSNEEEDSISNKGEKEKDSKLEGSATTQNDKQVTSNDNEQENEKEKVSQSVININKDTASSGKQEISKQEKKVKTEAGEEEDDDEMNWQEMLLNGLEDREKVLLTEYTAILRNYKEVKRKLSDVEKKKEDGLFEMTLRLREHKVAVSRRDQEIRSLRQKLNLLQENPEEIKDFEEEIDMPSPHNEEFVKSMLIDQSRSISPIEERLRNEIDALLDQNLDFWLRFSTYFHQIQKYRSGYEDLLAEIQKVKEKQVSNREQTDIKSELKPIYRHLKEIQTELNVWIDQSASLKDELQRRFSSLCHIQEEITSALKAGAEEEELKFTSHEAAKFQGEVGNMKQENNMVRDELEGGLEHVTILQQEINKTVAALINELGLSGSRTNSSMFRYSTSRSRVPLHSFIFGTKQKKKSIFARMHPKKIQEM